MLNLQNSTLNSIHHKHGASLLFVIPPRMHFVRSCVGLFTPSCKIFWDVGYSSDKLSVRPFNSLLKPSPDFRFSFKSGMLITKFCSVLLSVFRNEMAFFGNTTLNQAYFPALSLQRKFDKQSSSTTCYKAARTKKTVFLISQASKLLYSF